MTERPDLAATSLGVIAADVLRHATEIEVVATFDQSFYLQADDGLIAVCVDALGRGPINVTVAATPEAWRGHVHTGLKGRVEPQRVVLDDGAGTSLGISLARAEHWTPPVFPPWPSAHLAANLTAFGALAVEACPIEGLSALVFAPQRKLTHTRSAARETWATLRGAMPACLGSGAWTAEAAMAATLMIGLGPGATPSGDDVLGGLMLALTVRGELGVRDALWDHIVGELGALTVPISAMHLSAAADGMGGEAMHRVINALLEPSADPQRIVADLAMIGATSGWDAAAGFVAGITA